MGANAVVTKSTSSGVFKMSARCCQPPRSLTLSDVSNKTRHNLETQLVFDVAEQK